jgi:sensor c-di-GMP phosphodiesterase-like protein
MNANEAIDIDHVYISQGWESMKFLDDLSIRETYQVYVKMQPQIVSKIVAGDVYVSCNNLIVVIIGQCRFQCVPRVILSTLLPVTIPKSRVNTAFSTSEKVHQEPIVSQRPSTMAQPPTKIAQPAEFPHRAISIVAKEIGYEVDELEYAALFSDMGVGSLLSVTILGKFRELLDLEVDSGFVMEL